MIREVGARGEVTVDVVVEEDEAMVFEERSK